MGAAKGLARGTERLERQMECGEEKERASGHGRARRKLFWLLLLLELCLERPDHVL